MPKLKLPVTLLRYPLFSKQRTKLLESFRNLENTFLNHCDDDLVSILLYGSSKYSFSTNNKGHLSIAFLRITRYRHLLLSF